MNQDSLLKLNTTNGTSNQFNKNQKYSQILKYTNTLHTAANSNNINLDRNVTNFLNMNMIIRLIFKIYKRKVDAHICTPIYNYHKL